MTLVTLIFLLLITGLCAGFLAGLLGIGGGVVLVPAFIYIFSFYYEAMAVTHMSIGTSLAVIVPTGLASALAHYKHGHLDKGLLKTIGSGIVFGVFMGTLMAATLSGESLRGVFAVILAVLAVLMMKKRRLPAEEAPALSQDSSSGFYPGRLRSGLAGVVIGAVSSLIGIGGASLSVPFMILHHVPAHKAVGTAAALGLLIALPAAIGFIIIGWTVTQGMPYTLGYVNYAAVLCILPASVAAAPLGAGLAKRLPVTVLRRGFAVFLLIVSARMLYGLVYG